MAEHSADSGRGRGKARGAQGARRKSDDTRGTHRKSRAAQSQAPSSVFERVSQVRRGRSRSAEHAVFLLPGLLGFDSIATFSYFAERVVAALRASLELVSERPVPVVALPTPPTASLAERQRRLLRSMGNRLEALEREHGPLRVHLVGHSTGGLDANLLLLPAPTGAESQRWSELDPRAPALRERIDSIVSIASPHQGACFSRDALARLVGQHDLRGLGAGVRVILEFLSSLPRDLDVQRFIASRLREVGKSWRLWNVAMQRWPLIADIDPARVPPVGKLERPVLRHSFVTVAAQAVTGDEAHERPDRLFLDLAQRASGLGTHCAEEGPLVAASVARLQRALRHEADELLIVAKGASLPAQLDASCNDGFVNSARQLMNPDDPAELIGIVVADHFDVIGYYDRNLWSVDREGREQQIRAVSGLLHSGSGFGDEQFFELYRRVGRVIANAMR